MTKACPRVTALTCLLLVAVLTSGCGVKSQSDPEPVPLDRLPSSAVGPRTTGQAPLRERVWGVRGDLLVPVFVGLSDTGAESRLQALLALPEAGGQAPTLLDAGTRLEALTQEGDLLEIDLTSEPQRVPARRRTLLLGQIVLTVTEDPGARRVRIRSGGAELRLTDPAGRPVTRPLQRSDFDGLAAQSADD